MRPMITVRITLKGDLAEAAGENRMEYGITPGARCGELLALMSAKRPALAEQAERFICSLNGRQVALDTALSDGDHLELDVRKD